MYPKKFRLPLKGRKFKSDGGISSGCFLVKTTPNGLRINRFAIVIKSGTIQSSVKRHFWKRTIADNIKKWPNVGRDFLILVRSEVESLSKSQAVSMLGEIFRKLDTHPLNPKP